MHPLMPLLLTFDFYLLAGYSKVMNQTTWTIDLLPSKKEIALNRLNFLGYQKEVNPFKENVASMRNITFMGAYTNEYINLDSKGILPSINWYLNWKDKREKEAKNKEILDAGLDKKIKELKSEQESKREHQE